MKLFVFALLIALSTGGVFPSNVSAETILFESGTLGVTGVPFSDLVSGAVPSTSVSSTVYTGVRFELDQPVKTSQVGGHFVARDDVGTFFGAIVQLDDENDFPDSGDFSTSDFLDSTLLTFPAASDEAFGDLDLSLNPGWYALIFGSGLFGATAEGATVRNGVDIGSPSYIGFQPLSPFGWVNRTSVPNRRFVVIGHVLPEPTSFVILLTLAVTAASQSSARLRRTFSLWALLFAFCAGGVFPSNVSAETILFETATLGPTGIAQGDVETTNVNTNVYTGVRFELTQPVVTSQIGGHFVARSNGSFFGAIISLEDENDFPNSGDLSTSDVLGHTELAFPVPSAEVFGNLELSLNPGWYAIVFGSGLFGTDGTGVAPRNNTDIGNPSYIGFQSGDGWLNITELSTVFVNHNFVIKGSIVPEPTSFVILLALVVTAASQSSARLRRTCSLWTLLFAFCAGGLESANAATLYSQTIPTNPTTSSSSQNKDGSHKIADNFKLQGDDIVTIKSMRFIGGYGNTAPPPQTPDIDELPPDNFRITFLADDNGKPGLQIPGGDFNSVEVITRNPTGGTLLNSIVHPIVYGVNIGEGVELNPETPYWLSITNDTGDDFFWNWASANGVFDSQAASTFDSVESGPWQSGLYGGAWFELSDHNIPEPTSALILLAFLVTAASQSRKCVTHRVALVGR